MSDYDKGMSDSQNGVPAQDNASDAYIEGYGLVYECDAVHAHVMDLENFNAEYAAL